MQTLVIIDPGLYEVGGHHAALLYTMAAKKQKKPLDITIYSSFHVANELNELASGRGLKIKPWFKSNFYQHFEDNSNFKSATLNAFIRGLALEFKSAILDVLEKKADADDVTFWYPCVNWEHANALSLALSQLADLQHYVDCACKHKVCSMFMSQQPEQKFANLPYETSFKRLNKLSNVELFASDWELRDYLESLGINVRGIHPCYLLPWSNIESTKEKYVNTENSSRTFLLYMGDAKENKGFTLLPALIHSLSAKHSNDVKFVVQYTMTWSSPELAIAEQQLTELVGQVENLELHKAFWSVEELIHVLSSTDLLYCTYDVSAYHSKSSGLAWLASFFNIPVVLRGESWLTREFARLRHPFEVSPTLTYSTQLLEKSTSQTTEYRNSLFLEPIDWLYKN